MTTDNEFLSTLDSGQAVLYLQSLLAGLGFKMVGATVLHKDNKAAILMLEESQATCNTCHIGIRSCVFARPGLNKILSLCSRFLLFSTQQTSWLRKFLGLHSLGILTVSWADILYIALTYHIIHNWLVVDFYLFFLFSLSLLHTVCVFGGAILRLI